MTKEELTEAKKNGAVLRVDYGKDWGSDYVHVSDVQVENTPYLQRDESYCKVIRIEDGGPLYPKRADISIASAADIEKHTAKIEAANAVIKVVEGGNWRNMQFVVEWNAGHTNLVHIEEHHSRGGPYCIIRMSNGDLLECGYARLRLATEQEIAAA